MKLPRGLKEALDETGVPWTIERGKRHYHIRMDGRLVGVIGLSTSEIASRATKNIIAQARRVARTKEQAAQ